MMIGVQTTWAGGGGHVDDCIWQLAGVAVGTVPAGDGKGLRGVLRAVHETCGLCSVAVGAVVGRGTIP